MGDPEAEGTHGLSITNHTAARPWSSFNCSTRLASFLRPQYGCHCCYLSIYMLPTQAKAPIAVQKKLKI